MSKNTELDDARVSRLKHYTEIVKQHEAGAETYLSALAIIHDEKLYLAGHWRNWEQWVKDNCQLGGRQIRRLLARKNTLKMLAEMGETPEPIREKPKESAKTELGSEPNADSESNKKEPPRPTPAVTVKQKDSPIYDLEGNELKFDSRKNWLRRDEVKVVLAKVDELREYLELTVDPRDVIWHEINFSDLEGTLDDLRHIIRQAIPHAVCTECYGAPSVRGGKCGFCGNKGLISKARWDIMVAQEKKALLVKSASQPK